MDMVPSIARWSYFHLSLDGAPSLVAGITLKPSHLARYPYYHVGFTSVYHFSRPPILADRYYVVSISCTFVTSAYYVLYMHILIL